MIYSISIFFRLLRTFIIVHILLLAGVYAIGSFRYIADLYLPLTLLIASIYTLQSTEKERLMLQSHGFSLLRLSLPYFFLTLLLLPFSTVPSTAPYVTHKDHAYQSDFTDFYWIQPDAIWHAKRIDRNIGYDVDRIEKDRVTSFPTYSFPFSVHQERPIRWYTLLFTAALFLFPLKGRFLPFFVALFCYLLFYSVMKTCALLGAHHVVQLIQYSIAGGLWMRTKPIRRFAHMLNQLPFFHRRSA